MGHMQINEIRSHHSVASIEARSETCHCDARTIMKVALTILLIGAAAVSTVYFLTPFIGLVYAITATICTPIILSIIALALSKLCGKKAINKNEKDESIHKINPPLEQREMEFKDGFELHRYNPQIKEQIHLLKMHSETIRIHEEELAAEANAKMQEQLRIRELEKQEEEHQINREKEKAQIKDLEMQPPPALTKEQDRDLTYIKQQASLLAKRAVQDLKLHQELTQCIKETDGT